MIAIGLSRRALASALLAGGYWLLAPAQIKYAVAGPVILSVSDGDVIHRFDAASGAPILPDISLLATTGVATGPGGDLFAVHSIPSEVFRYDTMTGAQIGVGPFVTFNGQNDGHDVQGPMGMDFGLDGNLYIADVTESNVHIYDTAGGSVGSLTSIDPILSQPTDVAFDAAGNLYVANSGQGNVLRSDGGTQPLYSYFPSQEGGLTIPWALTVGPDGKLYVLDVSNGTGPAIRRYTSDGVNGMTDGDFINFAATTFQPADLAFGPDGELYVSGIDLFAGPLQGQILRFASDGSADGVFVTDLTYPTFLAFSSVPEVSSLAAVGAASLVACLGTALRRRRSPKPPEEPTLAAVG